MFNSFCHEPIVSTSKHENALVDSTQRHRLGTFDYKKTQFGNLRRKEKKKPFDVVLDMEPTIKRMCARPYHPFDSTSSKQHGNIVDSTQRDQLGTFGNESTRF
jgi:hypothetical protein